MISDSKEELKKKFQDEYKHNFMSQGIASLLGVFIAFISCIYLFGWKNLFIILIIFMIYIIAALFQTQIKRYIERKKII